MFIEESLIFGFQGLFEGLVPGVQAGENKPGLQFSPQGDGVMGEVSRRIVVSGLPLVTLAPML